MDASVEELRLHESVAGEVRAELARRRLSGRQAAIRLGWTQPYMSRRLTGEIPFNLADLEEIAGLLNVTPESFFPEENLSGDRVEFRKAPSLTLSGAA